MQSWIRSVSWPGSESHPPACTSQTLSPAGTVTRKVRRISGGKRRDTAGRMPCTVVRRSRLWSRPHLSCAGRGRKYALLRFMDDGATATRAPRPVSGRQRRSPRSRAAMSSWRATQEQAFEAGNTLQRDEGPRGHAPVASCGSRPSTHARCLQPVPVGLSGIRSRSSAAHIRSRRQVALCGLAAVPQSRSPLPRASSTRHRKPDMADGLAVAGAWTTAEESGCGVSLPWIWRTRPQRAGRDRHSGTLS